MKKTLIAGLTAFAMLTAITSSASAGQYSLWGPSGYSNTYTDFSFSSPSGSTYTGTIWGQ
jgi:hypothetical protein